MKQLHEYVLQPWSRSRQSILDLAELGRQIGESNDDEDSLWTRVIALDDWLTAVENSDELEFSLMQKNAIGLLDVDLAADFMSAVNYWQSRFSDSVNLVSDEEIFGDASSHVSFVFLRLNKAVDNLWTRGAARLLSKDQVKIMDLAALVEALDYQLFHICVVSNLIRPLSGVTYSMEEVENILLRSVANYDPYQLIRVIVEGARSENRHELARIFTSLLETDTFLNQTEYAWDEVLFLSLILDVVYARFETLPEGAQIFYLKNYCYRAIVLGAPVRAGIQNVLFATRRIEEYLLICQVFSEAMERNNEKISIGIEPKTEKMLKDILSQLRSVVGMEADNGYTRSNFVKDLFAGASHRDQLGLWLQEYLYIYFHIKNANLIDHNIGGELNVSQLYTNDVIKLMAWFGIGIDGADDIVSYFKKPGQRVSLKSFLKRVSETADLSNEIVVDNCLEITDALHQAILLPADKDMIEFSEIDNQFHWAEWISQ